MKMSKVLHAQDTVWTMPLVGCCGEKQVLSVLLHVSNNGKYRPSFLALLSRDENRCIFRVTVLWSRAHAKGTMRPFLHNHCHLKKSLNSIQWIHIALVSWMGCWLPARKRRLLRQLLSLLMTYSVWNEQARAMGTATVISFRGPHVSFPTVNRGQSHKR